MTVANELHVVVYESPVGIQVQKCTRDQWLKLSATLDWSRPDFEGQPVWVKWQRWISAEDWMPTVQRWLHEQNQEAS